MYILRILSHEALSRRTEALGARAYLCFPVPPPPIQSTESGIGLYISHDGGGSSHQIIYGTLSASASSFKAYVDQPATERKPATMQHGISIESSSHALDIFQPSGMIGREAEFPVVEHNGKAGDVQRLMRALAGFDSNLEMTTENGT